MQAKPQTRCSELGKNNPHLWAKFSLRLPVHNLSWNCGKVHLNFSLPCKPPAEKFCTKNQEARLRSQIGPILHTAPTSTDDKRGCRARRRTQSAQGLRVPGRQPRFPPARGHCGGAPRVPTPTPAPAEPILRLTFLRAPELPKSAPAKLLHAPRPASPAQPRCTNARRFSARCPWQRTDDGVPQGPSLLQSDTERAERKEAAFFFSGALSWEAGDQSQTSLVPETGKDEGNGILTTPQKSERWLPGV